MVSSRPRCSAVCSPVICRTSSLGSLSLGSVGGAVGSSSSFAPPPLPSRPVVSAVVGGRPSSAAAGGVAAVAVSMVGERFSRLRKDVSRAAGRKSAVQHSEFDKLGRES